MLCPACATTLALVLAGTTSSVGLSTIAVGLRRRLRRLPLPEQPFTELEQQTESRNVASRAEWLVARRALLAKEKEATRLRDALAAERRALPMVRLEKAYHFDGPGGRVSLRDLFGKRRQLIVYHFMFAPEWDEGCRSCSYVMDNVEGGLPHLAAADTAFVAVSRAPLAKIEAFKARMGWRFPWVSSGGADFNYDFHVTLDEARGSVEYNYERAAELRRRGEIPQVPGDLPGFSVFLRRGDDVFHTYSTYQRGVDIFLNTFNLLDLTPSGRGETRPMEWVRHRDRYAA